MTRLLLLYALAWAGGAIAYAPLLTLLLPAKVALVTGDARVAWLGGAMLAGAIAASISNVAFGWISDRTLARGGRRDGWVLAGLALTVASYGVLHAAQDGPTIIAGLVMFQIVINMMLAPLAAIAADRIPDTHKGMLGGLMSLAQPAGAVAGVLATLPLLAGEGPRFALVCGMMVIFILPLLVFCRAERGGGQVARAAPAAERFIRRRDLVLLWMARLFVQIAGLTLFGFLLYYFMALPGSTMGDDGVARLIGVTLVLAVPFALGLGKLSDRLAARRPFLVGATIAMAAGLALMATQPSVPVAIAGYILFGTASAIFQALHAIYTMQLLPSPAHHGRDLGIFNLTNTLPSVVAPLLTVAAVTIGGFDVLMAILAGFTLLAGLAVLAVRSER